MVGCVVLLRLGMVEVEEFAAEDVKLLCCLRMLLRGSSRENGNNEDKVLSATTTSQFGALLLRPTHTQFSSTQIAKWRLYHVKFPKAMGRASIFYNKRR